MKAAVLTLAVILVTTRAAAEEPPPPRSIQTATGPCDQQVQGNNNRVTLLCTIEGVPKWPFFVAGGAAVVAGTVVWFHAHAQQGDQLALDAYDRDPHVQQSLKTQDILASGLFAGGGALLFVGTALWVTPALADAFGHPKTAVTPWVDPRAAGVTWTGRF